MTTMRTLGLLVLSVAVLACAGAQHPNGSTVEPRPASPLALAPAFLLLEPTGKKTEDGLPIVEEIDPAAPARQELGRIIRRPFVQWVLQLGVESRRLAQQRCSDAPEQCAARFDHPAFFVVMKGGNRPKQGLAIQSPEGMKTFPRASYVEIDPRRADLLIPHEYGHAIMSDLLPGDVPDHPSTLPHTTSAITNDIVAFSEGWGIHFETLAADRRETQGIYQQRHRDGFSTAAPYTHGDSTISAKDLLSYSQSYRRYGCIKENCFAFLPRVRPPFYGKDTPTADDLLARWTDATHDPAQLRSLNQMVASEGVIAALFYRLGTAQASAVARLENGDPALPPLERYVAMLTAFQSLTEARLKDTPAVLAFLEALMLASSPDERQRIARVALEVFHYTPVLDDAQEFYAQLHAHGHVMNRNAAMALLKEKAVLMEAAVKRVAADPKQLSAKPVRELWLANNDLRFEIAIFGEASIPLVFDLNTAPVEFLMTLPGVDLERADAIRSQRDQRGGFVEVEELKEVPGLPAKVVVAAQKMRSRFLSAGSK